MNAHPRWRIRRMKDGRWSYTRQSFAPQQPWIGGNAKSFAEAIKDLDQLIRIEKSLAGVA